MRVVGVAVHVKSEEVTKKDYAVAMQPRVQLSVRRRVVQECIPLREDPHAVGGWGWRAEGWGVRVYGCGWRV